jgi:hypothetical protein
MPLCSRLPVLCSPAPTDSDLLAIERVFSDGFLKAFMLPTFYNTLRENLVLLLFHSPTVVQDALVACAYAVPSTAAAQDEEASPVDNCRLTCSYGRASLALAVLRNLKIENIGDLLSCVALGASLFTFAIHACMPDAFTMCRSVLTLVKGFYKASVFDASVDLSFMSCLMLHETSVCLIESKVPTLRQPPPSLASLGVDRYLGICQTLLPYFYDLCVLSNDMLYSGRDGVNERLDALERDIRNWQPLLSEELMGVFTSPEILHINCQANAMQTAALLVVHRLRFPFGSEQIAGLALASNIIRQLKLAIEVTRERVRDIELPLLVACLEVEEEEERSRLRRSLIPTGAVSTQSEELTKRWLTAVWETRRLRSGIFWYHLGQVGAPLS